MRDLLGRKDKAENKNGGVEMRVLVACEYSGTVRDAFRALGHDAVSCDIVPSERPGPHLQCDVLEVLDQGWDMTIAFPECRYLAYVGEPHMHKPGRAEKRAEARVRKKTVGGRHTDDSD